MTNPVAPSPYGDGVPPQYAAPEASGATPAAEPPKKKRGLGKRIGGIVVALVVGLGLFGVKSYLNRDETAQAKVGDCIATPAVTSDKEQEADAQVAACGSADAAYSVVGRVENDTDTDSKACDQYFTEEKAEYAVYASTGGNGYLLCLKKV